MPVAQRAKQFMGFEALTEWNEAVDAQETAAAPPPRKRRRRKTWRRARSYWWLGLRGWGKNEREERPV